MRSSNIHTKRTHVQKRLDYLHIKGSWSNNQHNWWGVGVFMCYRRKLGYGDAMEALDGISRHFASEAFSCGVRG